MFRLCGFIFFLFFNSSVFADTYAAISSKGSTVFVSCGWYQKTQQAQMDACVSNANASYPGGFWTYNPHPDPDNWLPYASLYNSVYTCPGGGTVSGSNCINAPACSTPQIHSSTTGLCVDPAPLPFCVAGQNPIDNDCKYDGNPNKVNCLDGSTAAYADCPSYAGKWQDYYPNPVKPMCSPLQLDHSACTPLLFQKIDDWVSSHAFKFGSAIVALGGGIISGTLGFIDSTATLVVDYPVLYRNAAGEMVDTQVRAEVPSAAYGQAVTDLVKFNPDLPYVSGLPAVLTGAQGPGATPIIRDPNTGTLKYEGSDIPFTANQVADMTKAINPTFPAPLPEVAAYLPPERIPWLSVAEPAIKGDLDHLFNPQYFPIEPVPARPISVQTPDIIRTPSPLSVPEYGTAQQPVIIPPPSESTVRGIEPIVIFTPESPAVYPPVSYNPLPVSSPNPAPSPQTNSNPNGTDSPISDLDLIPQEPINPADIIGAPPVPPDIYDDKWKFFDFVPTVNPFKFHPSDYLPQVPEPVCWYEINEVIHVPFLGDKPFRVAPCVPLQPLRAVLAWVFSVLSLFTCLFIIFKAEV